MYKLNITAGMWNFNHDIIQLSLIQLYNHIIILLGKEVVTVN